MNIVAVIFIVLGFVIFLGSSIMGVFGGREAYEEFERNDFKK